MTFPDTIGLGNHTFIPLKIEANGEHVLSEGVIDSTTKNAVTDWPASPREQELPSTDATSHFMALA